MVRTNGHDYSIEIDYMIDKTFGYNRTYTFGGIFNRDEIDQNPLAAVYLLLGFAYHAKPDKRDDIDRVASEYTGFLRHGFDSLLSLKTREELAQDFYYNRIDEVPYENGQEILEKLLQDLHNILD